jgi:hypothetical protein
VNWEFLIPVAWLDLAAECGRIGVSGPDIFPSPLAKGKRGPSAVSATTYLSRSFTIEYVWSSISTESRTRPRGDATAETRFSGANSSSWPGPKGLPTKRSLAGAVLREAWRAHFGGAGSRGPVTETAAIAAVRSLRLQATKGM